MAPYAGPRWATVPASSMASSRSAAGQLAGHGRDPAHHPQRGGHLDDLDRAVTGELAQGRGRPGRPAVQVRLVGHLLPPAIHARRGVGVGRGGQVDERRACAGAPAGRRSCCGAPRPGRPRRRPGLRRGGTKRGHDHAQPLYGLADGLSPQDCRAGRCQGRSVRAQQRRAGASAAAGSPDTRNAEAAATGPGPAAAGRRPCRGPWLRRRRPGRPAARRRGRARCPARPRPGPGPRVLSRSAGPGRAPGPGRRARAPRSW